MAGLTLALGYLVLRWWALSAGALPRPSWASVLLLFFMAAGVVFAGLPIRRALRGTAGRRLNPLRAFRTLVLAQACALTGALVAGWYLAQVLVLWPDTDAGSVRGTALLSGVLALSGAALVGVGMWVQSVCRLDPPPDDPDDPDDPDHPDRPDRTADRDDAADRVERADGR